VIDKTSSQGIRCPGLLSSYKRVGQGSGEKKDNEEQAIHKIAINISNNHLVLSFSPLWDLGSPPSLASL
jgi:hypothetical protein